MPLRPDQLPSRRELLALTAVLAATTLTAGVAIAGLAHRPTAPVQVVSTISQQQSQTTPFREQQEPGG